MGKNTNFSNTNKHMCVDKSKESKQDNVYKDQINKQMFNQTDLSC